MCRRTVSSGAVVRLPALSQKPDKICFKSVKNFRDESNLQDLLQHSLQKRMWELASALCLLTVPSNSGNASWDSVFEHDSERWWEDPGHVTKSLAGQNWRYLLKQGHKLTVLQLASEVSPRKILSRICLWPWGWTFAGKGSREEKWCSKNHTLLQLMTQIYTEC